MYKRQVLSRFSKDELKIFENEIEAAADAVETILKYGVDRAMNEYNGMEFK